MLQARRSTGANGGLAYYLTSEGASHLESLEGSAVDAYRERCRALAEVLEDRDAGPLEEVLERASRRVEQYRQEEQISPEDDLLGRFFHSTFSEPL